MSGMIAYRVRGTDPATGTEFILENFEARSDAEAYYKALQTDADGILAALPYPAVLLSFEESVNGVWTFVSKKVAVRG